MLDPSKLKIETKQEQKYEENTINFPIKNEFMDFTEYKSAKSENNIFQCPNNCPNSNIIEDREQGIYICQNCGRQLKVDNLESEKMYMKNTQNYEEITEVQKRKKKITTYVKNFSQTYDYLNKNEIMEIERDVETYISQYTCKNIKTLTAAAYYKFCQFFRDEDAIFQKNISVLCNRDQFLEKYSINAQTFKKYLRKISQFQNGGEGKNKQSNKQKVENGLQNQIDEIFQSMQSYLRSNYFCFIDNFMLPEFLNQNNNNNDNNKNNIQNNNNNQNLIQNINNKQKLQKNNNFFEQDFKKKFSEIMNTLFQKDSLVILRQGKFTVNFATSLAYLVFSSLNISIVKKQYAQLTSISYSTLVRETKEIEDLLLEEIQQQNCSILEQINQNCDQSHQNSNNNNEQIENLFHIPIQVYTYLVNQMKKQQIIQDSKYLKRLEQESTTCCFGPKTDEGTSSSLSNYNQTQNQLTY